MSVEKLLETGMENNRTNVNNDSVSDIFTINSQKTYMSDIIYHQEDNEARIDSCRNSNSDISILTNNQKLKDDLLIKKNIHSNLNNTCLQINNPNVEKYSNYDLNKSLMVDGEKEKEKQINAINLSKNNFKSSLDNFKNPDYLKENINKNAKKVIGKNITTLINKNTSFIQNKESLDQINKDETIFLKKSKTTKYTKKKPDSQDINSKIKKLFTKEKKETKLKKHSSLSNHSDCEPNKIYNITLNYKGFNINSMIFNESEKKKLKYRYKTFNLNISSSSSFFDSEKDEEKFSFVNQATHLRKCKTSKFDTNYESKAVKNNKFLTNNDRTLSRKKIIYNYDINSTNKKDFNKSKICSESKTEKEIMIKNQLTRALTSTIKKDYNEDINNFYTFSYENNKESVKIKNFDKHFSKKSSINKKNKISNYNTLTGNNTIKEKNSIKYFNEVSRASEFFEFKKDSGDINENNEPIGNYAFNDLKNKENIKNNKIKSDFSLLNSNNSKNIIYINNLNINYSNQNVNSIENFNNPAHDNNFIFNSNEKKNLKSDRLSLENRSSILNNVNKIIYSNNFVSQETPNAPKQKSDQDFNIINHLSNKKIINFQNMIENTNLNDPLKQLQSNPTKQNYDKNYLSSNKNDYKNNKIKDLNKNNKINRTIKNPNKELNINKKISADLKTYNDDRQYNSDNIEIIKISHNSNSNVRFKNIEINSSHKIYEKLEFNSESESKSRKSEKPEVEIRSDMNKSENNGEPSRFLIKNNNLNNSKTRSVCKNANNNINKLIRSPNINNNDYYESDANYLNMGNKKKSAVKNKMSETTKINPKNNTKSSKSKSIFESNRGINLYSGINVPLDSCTWNNNNNINKNSYSNNNALYNIRTNSNQNSYQLNSTMSKPNKSIPNNKLILDTNITKNKTLNRYKSFLDVKPGPIVKKSGNDVNYKNFWSQNFNNLNNHSYLKNSNSVSQMKLFKKKSFLENPYIFMEKGGNDFLKILNNKITYDAFLYKNKEVLQSCVKDFLDDIQGESRFKHIMNRLNNLELLVKEYVKNSNSIVNNRIKTKKTTNKINYNLSG